MPERLLHRRPTVFEAANAPGVAATVDGLLRRHDHRHLPSLHPRYLLDLGDLLEITLDPHQDIHPQLLMRQLAPAEPHGYLNLVAFLDEFDHAAPLDVVIVIVDARTQFNFLDRKSTRL